MNRRARGISDPEICEAFGWFEVPQQFLNVWRPTGARAHVSWTANEDEELRRLTAAGLTSREIATAVGRSGSAVAMRRLSLGIGKPGARRWTTQDDAQLVAVFGSGGDDASIARALSRSAQSILNRRHRLGLMRKKRWSSEDIATLTVMAAAGSSPKAIAARLGWSRSAVYGRRNPLGFPARGHWTPWTPEEDSLLLRLQASGRSYTEIGKELGRTEAAVARRASVIKG